MNIASGMSAWSASSRVLATTLALGVASIVSVVSVSGVARAQPQQPLAASDTLRERVALPATPADLEPQIERLRDTAAKTIECYTEHGERTEHVADRRCPRWFAQLEHGGVASAFAIGGYLVEPRTERTDGREPEVALAETDGAWQTGPRLVRLLAASDGATATPFLVAYFAVVMRDDFPNQEVARAIAEVLPRVTGSDPSPVAPWDSVPYASANQQWRRVARDWVAWWHGASADPREKWLTDGVRRAREGLHDADPLRRFVSIQRLASSPEDRDAVRASWTELIGRADLAANVRAYLVRFGRRSRLPSGPRGASALARAVAS